MKLSLETSQKIKNMGLLCAILVVSIHVGWPHDRPLSAGWFAYHAFAQGLSRIAVPFFFVVSGFFLAGHFDDDNWWRRETAKRIKTLLVPFVFWCAAVVVFCTPASIAADMIARRPFGTNIAFMHGTKWLRILGLDFTDYPIHVPLWYVRCLFLFVLTSFAFKHCIAKFGYAWLAAAFVFNLAVDHIPDESVQMFFQRAYATNGIFYFSVGIFLCRFPQTALSKRCVALCGVAGVSLLMLKLLFAYNGWGWRFETCISKLSLPFLLCFIWHVMPAWRLPQWMTASSFPIFLMHPIALCYIGVAMNRIPVGAMPAALAGFAGSIAVSVAGSVLLRRFTPRFANIVFGGR